MYPSDAIDTVGELIAALGDYDPDTPIRWAAQPGWPFEYTIGAVVCTPADAEGDGTAPTDQPVVWLAQGRQVDYLPPGARTALGWS
ncbi:MAG: hypothetical protein ACRDQG_04660 [Pseudonocardiaceae bacterium]